MANIKVLRQRLQDLKAEGREKLGAVKALEDKDTLDETQEQKLAALNAELDDLDAQVQKAAAAVEAEERRLDRERAFGADALEAAEDRTNQAQSSGIQLHDTTPDPARTGGFANIGEFAMTVAQATMPGAGGECQSANERLAAMYQAAPTNYHRETGADEGYQVPPEFRDSIWELIVEQDNLLAEVDSESTSKNSVEHDADETTPWGSTGVQAKWRSEGSQLSASELTDDPRQLVLHPLYAFVLATEELLEDAPRLNARLSRKAPEAIRWKINESIHNGTGVGQPLGWMQSNALVTVTKESGQAADSLVAANVAKMFSRQINPARSVWKVNQAVLPQLMTMTLGDQPIWTPPASGFVNAPGGFLLGRPVQFTQHCETLGDKGDVQFVDPKGYHALTKMSGTQYAESIHLFFDYNMKAFRWTVRVGGQPHLKAPVSPAKGSATLSHFVTLDERA